MRLESWRESDLIYGRKFGLALTMEVFRAADANGAAVLWVVSNSGRSSRELTLQPSFERRISRLVERGYTVFAVIHGSAPGFHILDQIGDVRRAVRFTRWGARSYGIDPERIGLSGASAGGALALSVAMQAAPRDAAAADPVERMSAGVQAVGCFFAPTDFANFGESGEHVVDYMQRRYGVVDPSFQFPFEDDRLIDLLRESSPITHAGPASPPTLLIHGSADTVVPPGQAARLVERLTQHGVARRLVLRQDASHGWPGWDDDVALLADWFYEHLLGRGLEDRTW